MKALVTGAGGFVGSHVLRAVVQTGAMARALVRAAAAAEEAVRLGAEVVTGDVRSADDMTRALAGCDTLFHVAAYYSPHEADAPLLYDVNVRGTLTALLAAWRVGIQRVVLTSTIGALGLRADGQPTDESVPFNLWGAGSHYARSKHLGDLVALAVAAQGLPVVIVHPTGCVGAGDRKPSATGRRILDALRGQRVPYPPGGINFVPVTDVAQGHLLAAQKGQQGQRYILGHAQGNLREEEFLTLIAHLAGVPVPPLPPRPWWARLGRRASPAPGHLPRALTADPGRAIRELGLPQSSLEDAFRAAIAWFRRQGMV